MYRTVISNGGKAGLEPALLALDWGTSSFRAFLMDRSGKVMTQRANTHGIQNLPEQGARGFEMAFAELCGDWIGRWQGLPVVAGGMVGSAQGWKEAPYVVCPADTHALAARAVSVDSGLGSCILIAPGVLYDPVDAAPDVMRGEESRLPARWPSTRPGAGKPASRCRALIPSGCGSRMAASYSSPPT